MRNMKILLLRRGTFNNDKLDAGDIGPGHTAIVKIGASGVKRMSNFVQQEEEIVVL